MVTDGWAESDRRIETSFPAFPGMVTKGCVTVIFYLSNFSPFISEIDIWIDTVQEQSSGWKEIAASSIISILREERRNRWRDREKIQRKVEALISLRIVIVVVIVAVLVLIGIVSLGFSIAFVSIGIETTTDSLVGLDSASAGRGGV